MSDDRYFDLKAEIERLKIENAELRAWSDQVRASAVDIATDPYLVKREPGEPMFVLLGRDSAAHKVLAWWCLVRLGEIKKGERPDTPEERAQIDEVSRKADAFGNFWQQRNPKRTFEG